MSKRIYFISGLGADKRVFKNLTFPENYQLIHLDWIPPLTSESLENYAGRLSAAIDTTSPYYLVGLSFGGMLATEIAKKLMPQHTYIISSISGCTQIPWYYKLAGALRLHQAISLSLARRSNPIMYRLFGLKTQQEKGLFDEIIANTDPIFLSWALTCILRWRNTVKPAHLTHIHGTSDKILPIKYTQPDVVIKNGGHLMVFSHAKELSKVLSGTAL